MGGLLRLFHKQPKSKFYKSAARRSSNMSKGELLDWLDSTGTELARVIYDHRRIPTQQTAEEIMWAAHAISALADELAGRYKT